MSTQPINDGGTAFPAAQYGFVAPDGHTTGMSLLDWFAGMAMQGMLSNPNVRGNVDSDIITRDAYEVAKSMLKARKGGSHDK